MQDLQAVTGLEAQDLHVFADLIADHHKVFAIGALGGRYGENSLRRDHTTGRFTEVNQVSVVGIGDVKCGNAAVGPALQSDKRVGASANAGDRQVFGLGTFVVGTSVVIDTGSDRRAVDQITAVPDNVVEGVEDGD